MSPVLEDVGDEDTVILSRHHSGQVDDSPDPSFSNRSREGLHAIIMATRCIRHRSHATASKMLYGRARVLPVSVYTPHLEGSTDLADRIQRCIHGRFEKEDMNGEGRDELSTWQRSRNDRFSWPQQREAFDRWRLGGKVR